MGIFDRVSKLIKSNANAAIDKLEDPSKQVDQLILEMEEQLRRARGETQKGMAAEKLAGNRLADAERKAADWGRRAEEAVRRGDDALAREALSAQEEAEGALGLARREHAEAAATARAQREALDRLDARLREAKLKKGTIKAKIGAGRNVDVTAAALDDFERMTDRIGAEEGQVEAAAEIADLDLGGTAARDASVEERLARLKGGDVDDRLAALKKKMDERK